MQHTQTSFIHSVHRSRFILIWVGLYLLFVLFQLQRFSLIDSLLSNLATIVPMILMAVMVQYVYIPYFLQRHRLWLFYILGLLTVIAINFVSVRVDSHILMNLMPRYPEHFPQGMTEGILTLRVFIQLKYTFLVMATFVVVVVTHWVREQAAADARRKEEHLRSELRYLRAQINPHFLFNALNCIYSLSMCQSEKTPESIMQLSEMLRYVIDDCQNDHVVLSKELHYIRNYIDFQKIRMESAHDITFDCQITNPRQHIPPMIMQPLVENCFKHSGIESDPNAYIHISVEQKEQAIVFVAENSVQKRPGGGEPQKRVGIGVQNVRRRLGLYGAHSNMTETRGEGWYKVVMTLETSDLNTQERSI